MNSPPRVSSNLSPAGRVIVGGRSPAVKLPVAPMPVTVAAAAGSGT
jgi:hypothetical protein